MATDPTHLLTLDTLAHLSTVQIDGIAYPLSPPDALSVVDYKRLSVLIPRLEALWEKAALTADEEVELGALFDRLCRIVLEAPGEVINRLTDLQRVLVYQAFLQLPHDTLLRVGAMLHGGTQTTPTTTSSTGARSRRASRASTAAARSSGSHGSRSPSSGPAS